MKITNCQTRNQSAITTPLLSILQPEPLKSRFRSRPGIPFRNKHQFCHWISVSPDFDRALHEGDLPVTVLRATVTIPRPLASLVILVAAKPVVRDDETTAGVPGVAGAKAGLASAIAVSRDAAAERRSGYNNDEGMIV